jgi:hypothetical protein
MRIYSATFLQFVSLNLDRALEVKIASIKAFAQNSAQLRTDRFLEIFVRKTVLNRLQCNLILRWRLLTSTHFIKIGQTYIQPAPTCV